MSKNRHATSLPAYLLSLVVDFDLPFVFLESQVCLHTKQLIQAVPDYVSRSRRLSSAHSYWDNRGHLIESSMDLPETVVTGMTRVVFPSCLPCSVVLCVSVIHNLYYGREIGGIHCLLTETSHNGARVSTCTWKRLRCCACDMAYAHSWISIHQYLPQRWQYARHAFCMLWHCVPKTRWIAVNYCSLQLSTSDQKLFRLAKEAWLKRSVVHEASVIVSWLGKLDEIAALKNGCCPLMV